MREIKKYIIKYAETVKKMEQDIEYIKLALGRIEGRQLSRMKAEIEDCEYKVFSQWGEDGILQYILNHVEVTNRIFVEFGVEDYTECNTRFLLMNQNWSGFIMDGSTESVSRVKNSELYWRYNLKAEDVFITRENINDLLIKNGIKGDIGLLSIDIDGNDYWVWEAIDVISPSVVICEYNSLFGDKRKITTPYIPDFVRNEFHSSGLLYGASVKALEHLGKEKGYSLVAGNKAGNNLFFVKKHLLGNLKEKKAEEVYVKSQFREGRSENGKLNFLGFEERIRSISSDIELFDLDKKSLVKWSGLY